MRIRCPNCGNNMMPTNFDSVLTHKYILWCSMCHGTVLINEVEKKHFLETGAIDETTNEKMRKMRKEFQSDFGCND